MALNMSQAKTKQVLSVSNANSSDDLKKALTDKQVDTAKQMYYTIRKSFADAGAPMSRHDQDLAESIRLKILDIILAEGF